MLTLLVIAGLLRASFELHKPQEKVSQPGSFWANTSPTFGTAQPDSFNLQQKAWADKAVKRYAAAQEKKWRKWTEAMFEPIKTHLRVNVTQE
jgi:hypothetical protein